MLTDEFEIEIPLSKLKDYLLNFQHPEGAGKAKYFQQQGITDPNELQRLLLSIIATNEIRRTEPTAFGMKYIVDGRSLAKPAMALRTVWIVLNRENVCRFVTAYPL